MWQDSLSGFAFQAVVLLQPLLWMWLHDNRFNFPEASKYLFYLGAEAFIILVWVTEFEIGYYKTHLIIQYTIYTVLAVYLYNQRNSVKEAVCLGFLTVFLNSYYWELPTHVVEFLSGPPHLGMLVQLWRLAPIPFLLRHFKFNKWARTTLEIGVIFSMFVLWVRWFNHFAPWWLVPLNRLVCLLLLTKTIIEAEPKQV